MIFHVPGPCAITYNGNSLGRTKAGIIIRPQVIWIPIMADEGGDEPIDYIFGGRQATVEFIALDVDTVHTNLLTGINFLSASVIGTLVDQTTTSQQLVITERAGSGFVWTAPIAIPLEPETGLQATQETQLPLRFLIQQNSLGQLFTTLPTYMGG